MRKCTSERRQRGKELKMRKKRGLPVAAIEGERCITRKKRKGEKISDAILCVAAIASRKSSIHVLLCVLCVTVCVREREGEGGREREREREY